MDAERKWTVSKKQVEQYQINGPYGVWALITLDERGIFQATGDLGNYSYDGWAHHGCPSFKHFLVSIGRPGSDYFIMKVTGGAKVFDSEATEVKIRKRILKKRREKNIDKETARWCWDEFADVSLPDDVNETMHAVTDCCPTLFKEVFDEDYMDLSSTYVEIYPPRAVRFFEEIYCGQFVPALKAELGL